MGRPQTDVTREKIRQARIKLGKRSPETIAKIAATMKRRAAEARERRELDEVLRDLPAGQPDTSPPLASADLASLMEASDE